MRGLVGTGTLAPATKVELTLLPKRVRYPNATQVVGRLLGPDGAPIAGRSVKIEASKKGHFTKVATRTTASDGRFSAKFKPAGRRGIRARFVGGAGFASAISVAPTVQVRPQIEAKTETPSLKAGGTIVISGKIGPAKPSVRVVIERKTGPNSWKRVANLRVRTVKGRLRGLFHPKKAGTYRSYAMSPSDGDTLGAQSAKAPIKVSKP